MSMITRFRLAAWLLIASAISPVVVIAVMGAANVLVSDWVGRIIAAALFIILYSIGIYLAASMRILLERRYDYQGVSGVLRAFIYLYGTLAVVSVLSLILSSLRIGEIVLINCLISWLPLGIMSTLYGLRLMRFQDELHGLRKLHAGASVAAGICSLSILFFPLGIIIGIVNNIFMAIIFLSEADTIANETSISVSENEAIPNRAIAPSDARPVSLLAVTAFIASLMGWLVFWFIGEVIGITLGVMEKKRIRNEAEQVGGGGLATAAIVIGVSGIVTKLIIGVLLLLMFQFASAEFADFTKFGLDRSASLHSRSYAQGTISGVRKIETLSSGVIFRGEQLPIVPAGDVVRMTDGWSRRQAELRGGDDGELQWWVDDKGDWREATPEERARWEAFLKTMNLDDHEGQASPKKACGENIACGNPSEIVR